MAQRKGSRGGFRADVKGPLILSAVMAVIAFAAVAVFASGGTANPLRLDLAFIAAGVAFIVTVVVSATLMIVEKPNDPHLGEGTGVNRSSSKLYAEARAKREAAARRTDEAEFGQRVRPDTQGEDLLGRRPSPERAADDDGPAAPRA